MNSFCQQALTKTARVAGLGHPSSQRTRESSPWAKAPFLPGDSVLVAAKYAHFATPWLRLPAPQSMGYFLLGGVTISLRFDLVRSNLKSRASLAGGRTFTGPLIDREQPDSSRKPGVHFVNLTFFSGPDGFSRQVLVAIYSTLFCFCYTWSVAVYLELFWIVHF